MLSLLWEIIKQILSNFAFVAAIGAIGAAQLFKFLFYSLKARRPLWHYLISAGGVPSSHVATVVALSTALGLTAGFGSNIFMLSFVFSCIVIYDSIGVRQAAGLHARVINIIANRLIEEGILKEEEPYRKNLKELLGHNFWEAIIGGVIGFFFALFLFAISFPWMTF